MDNSMFNCEEAMNALLGQGGRSCNNQVDPQHIANMIQFPSEFQPLVLPTITLMSAVFNELISSRISEFMDQEKHKKQLLQPVPQPLTHEVTQPLAQEVNQPLAQEVTQVLAKEEPHTATPPKPPPLPVDFLNQLKSTIQVGPILVNKSQVTVSNPDSLIPASDNNTPVDTVSTSSLTSNVKGSRPSFAIGDIQAGLTSLKKCPVPVKQVAVEPSFPLKSNLRPITQRQSKSPETKSVNERDSQTTGITSKPSLTKLDSIRDEIDKDFNPSMPETGDGSLFGNRVKRKDSIQVNKGSSEKSQNIDPKLLELLNRQKKKAEENVLENCSKENGSPQSSSGRLESKLCNVENKPNILSEKCIPIHPSVDSTTASEVKKQAAEDRSLTDFVNCQIFSNRVGRRGSSRCEQSKLEKLKNITDPKLLERLCRQKEKVEGVNVQTSSCVFTEENSQTLLEDPFLPISNFEDKKHKPVILSKPLRRKHQNCDNNVIQSSLPWYAEEVDEKVENAPQVISTAIKSPQNNNSDSVLSEGSPIKPPPVPRKPLKPKPTVPISTNLEAIPQLLITTKAATTSTIITSNIPTETNDSEKITIEALHRNTEKVLSCHNSQTLPPKSCPVKCLNSSGIPPPPPPPPYSAVIFPSSSTSMTTEPNALITANKNSLNTKHLLFEQIKNGVKLKPPKVKQLCPKQDIKSDIARALEKRFKSMGKANDSESSDDEQNCDDFADDDWID